MVLMPILGKLVLVYFHHNIEAEATHFVNLQHFVVVPKNLWKGPRVDNMKIGGYRRNQKA